MEPSEPPQTNADPPRAPDSGADLALEQRLAECVAALQAANQRLDETQRLAQLGSWELDLTCNTLTWSAEIFRIFEIDPQRFGASYEAFLAAVHPQDRARVDAAYRESVERRTPYQIEHRLLMADGRVKHVRERGQTFYAPDGRPLRSIGTVQDITEQVRTAEALAASEARLRDVNAELERRVAARTAELIEARSFIEAVLDTVGALVVVLDSTGRIVRFNGTCERVTGYRSGEVIGRRVWDFLVPPREVEAVRAVFARLTAGECRNRFESHWRARDGAERLIEWSNTGLTDAAGAVEYVVATGIDVTEQRATEAAMMRFRAALDATADAVYLIDRATMRFVDANRAGWQSLGYPSREALLAFGPADIKPAVTRAEIESRFDALLAGRLARSVIDTVHRRADGSTFPVEVSVTALREGGQDLLVAVARDLTERKRTEQALRASEAYFQRLAENIREVFWLVSPDRSRLFYLSPAFERIWVRPREEIYANPRLVFDTIHPEDRPAVEAQLAPQLAGHFEEHYDHEFRILRPDGEIRWIHSRYAPVRAPDGSVAQVAGVSEDITERKEAERLRLEESARQRDALVREVHHRIKNNLQGVVGLLRRHAAQHPELGGALEGALLQVGTMALVHGLQSRDARERIFLCDMVEAVARAVTGMTGVTVRFATSRHETGPIVVAAEEAVALALIVNELVTNAAKHGVSDRAPVRATVQRTAEGAELEITNAIAGPAPRLRWPPAEGQGTGLQLVQSLLPRAGARLELYRYEGFVKVCLRLTPPVIEAAVDPKSS